MSAATAAAFVVVTTVTATVTTATAATTTFMAHLCNQFLDLFGSSLAILKNSTGKLQGFACQGVVGIQCHTVFLYLGDAHHEVLAFLVFHRDDCTGEDVGAVKLTVDNKFFTGKLVNTLSKILAKSFSGSQGKVEFLAFLHVDNALFKTVERETKPTDESEWASLLCLFYQVL
jgi:hypothetical protein